MRFLGGGFLVRFLYLLLSSNRDDWFHKVVSCHSLFPSAAHADEVFFLLNYVNSDEFITCFE